MGGGHPGGNSGGKNLNYDEVFGLASAMNFTVYCGGVMNSDENTIRAAFTPYGRILEIRYFRDKGYAFVRYDNKESACSAIVAVNMTQIAGQSVKCSWGKETSQQGGGNPHATSPGDFMQPRTDMGPPHFAAAEQPNFYHSPQPNPQQAQFYQQQMYDTSQQQQQYMMQPQPQYYAAPAAGNYGYGGCPAGGGQAPPPQGARNNY
jgi:nucleolysin TIA-1/TIAR